MNQTIKAPLRILLELRPALGGHAGIPQATRLLFRDLAKLDNLRISGLIQTGDKVLSRGVAPNGRELFRAMTTDQKLNRWGRIVVSVEQSVHDWHVKATFYTFVMVFNHFLGRSQRLTAFNPGQFQDFVWRRFFERTLPPEDFDAVVSAGFRVAQVPWNAMHICGLVTRRLGFPIYPRLDTTDFDFMIAETPYPGRVSRNTQLVIRYHDAIPLLMPHTIADRRFHQAFHYRALRRNVIDGAWFACVSETTRQDLLAIFPQAESRAVTIHNTVSQHYYLEESPPTRIWEVLRTRLNLTLKPPLDSSAKRQLFDQLSDGPLDYLLVVSTVEPRKNHLSLLSAWERLRIERYPKLRLIVVGTLGWHSKAIVRRFRPWLERGELFLLEDVLATELRYLYRHARATICPSFGEGFDYSGVEAMRSGGVVVASDIAVHREIYAEAAQYFNPYSIEALSHAIYQIIDEKKATYRHELMLKGAQIAARYTNDAILPKWQTLISSKAGKNCD